MRILRCLMPMDIPENTFYPLLHLFTVKWKQWRQVAQAEGKQLLFELPRLVVVPLPLPFLPLLILVLLLVVCLLAIQAGNLGST